MSYATKVFRHALALDERRAGFQPLTWDYPVSDRDQDYDSYSPLLPVKYEHDYTPPNRNYADVKEVWFAGMYFVDCIPIR